MIHHISIPANNPRHVADVLAELMGGRSYPFPGGIPDSFMAVTGDQHGTMIEVYPADMTLEPEGTPARKPGQKAQRGPFHVLLSVPLSRERIEAIGNREGWTTRFCGRGAPGQKPLFHLVEVWVEDHFLMEIAPQTMVGDYEKLLQFDALEQMMAARAG
jgi:hypothetical protein